MKKVLLAFVALLISLSVSAQAFEIRFGGVVTDYISGDPLQGARVSIVEEGDTLSSGITRRTGVYSSTLEKGKYYTFVYSAPGRVTKMVAADTRAVPTYTDVPAYEMVVQVGLFDSIPDFDFSVFDGPIGLAAYKGSVRNMSWDNPYTDSTTDAIAPVMKDYIKRLRGYSGRAWQSTAWVEASSPDTPAIEVDSVSEDTVADWLSDPEPAPARPVETVEGLFYTVQVGAYDNMVPLSEILGIGDLNTEPWKDGARRYTTGVFRTLEEAKARLAEVRPVVPDAFVTAYLEGKRITVAEAQKHH